MAKGNMFLGHAKGKVGSVVFSRLNGQQVARTYNANPSNPKTRAQALQRAQFATVIAASVGLREVINNSFDGAKNGQESVNKFVSENLNDIRTRGLTGDYTANEWLVPKGESFIQPQPWILSKGSLGKIRPNLSNIFGTPTAANIGDRDILFVSGKQLHDKFNYEPGSQLTFVTITLEVDNSGNYFLRPRYDRVVFNTLSPAITDNETPLIIYTIGGDIQIPTEFIDLTKSTLIKETSEDVVLLPDYIEVGDDERLPNIKIAVTDENGHQVLGLGIITTIQRNGQFEHSRSVFSENADGYDYTTDAVATYMNQSSRKVINSDYYTEQPDATEDDWQVPYLEDVVSAQIAASGQRAKGVYLGRSNSYGPIAEGTPLTLEIEVPPRFEIVRNSVTAYNGENPLGNDWQIVRGAALNRVIITGPMPTTATFAFNTSFRVFDTISGSNIGTGALRVNVSKANS